MSQLRPLSPFALPQELINAIIDELGAQKDIRSLASAGLVNRMWCPRTRNHLFRTLNIPSFSYDDKGRRMVSRCKLLSIVLRGRPGLLQYVKAASLSNIHEALFTLCPWFEEWIIGILKGFTSLTEISVSGLGGSSSIYWLQWEEVPAKLQEALFSIIAKPELSRLSLKGIANFQITRLAGCQNLQELSFNNLPQPTIETRTIGESPPPSSLDPTSHAAPHRSLRSLHITACGKTLAALLGTPGRRLAFRPELLSIDALLWDKAMTDAFVLLMQEGGGNVKKYSVRHHPTSPDTEGHPSSPFPTPIFDLMNFPRLESLTIATSTSTLIQEVPSLLSHLVTALDHLSARDYPSQLVEIKIELDFSPAYRDKSWYGRSFRDMALGAHFDLCVQQTAWAQLDETLARPMFENLRKVSIIVIGTQCSLPGDMWARLRRALLYNMEELHGRRAIVDCIEVSA